MIYNHPAFITLVIPLGICLCFAAVYAMRRQWKNVGRAFLVKLNILVCAGFLFLASQIKPITMIFTVPLLMLIFFLFFWQIQSYRGQWKNMQKEDWGTVGLSSVGLALLVIPIGPVITHALLDILPAIRIEAGVFIMVFELAAVALFVLGAIAGFTSWNTKPGKIAVILSTLLGIPFSLVLFYFLALCSTAMWR